MRELISEMSICDGKTCIFSDKTAKYTIPLYQRAFAWTDKEIVQLINDIEDFNDDHYFLGSLIVYKREAFYEVIDGQQRLTALYLLLKSLAKRVAIDIPVDSLSFDCRDKSNYTLANIDGLIDDEKIEDSIFIGKRVVDETLSSMKLPLEIFIDKLKKVKLYRIEVPQNTDLNRYFEIMNTRGEQLEQQDILKARLMSFIGDERNRTVFAAIWDACSEMSGYVQMHFNPKVRTALFGGEWGYLSVNETTLSYIAENTFDNTSKESKISDIIKPGFVENNVDVVDEDGIRTRFESVIDFRYFLLHALKVFIGEKNIVSCDDTPIISSLLDDKKLIAAFDKVVYNGVIDGKNIEKDRFSIDFVLCLLKCRFLFDKYVIKREYVNENADGEWSLKELKVSGQASFKKAYYSDTCFGVHKEWQKTYGPRTKTNLYLQSCLRVSYASPKIMHWITELLKWLYDDEHLKVLDEFERVIENVAKRAVREDYLNNGENVYRLGVDTPHIVFNYLDYLLWKRDKKVAFTFEYRNSVEHWYPQHPSEGTFETWSKDDGVNRFGNLCLIQRAVNSKFSNMAPEAKKSTFKDMIEKGSIKLRIMAGVTKSIDTCTASQNWKDCQCAVHEQEMIKVLKQSCGIDDIIQEN